MQIEREALAAEFTTTRLNMYILGAPHFQLATDHKPLLPLLNKSTAKLPPRIERIVMKMQNLDFTAIHITGKSNMTDYLSQHPLPETEETRHEKHIKAIIGADHAVVMETIAEATATDKMLCQLRAALLTGKWDQDDPALKPYYDLGGELYMAEGLILRLDKIIPPESLRDKIITTAHTQGLLEKSKTKEMIRRKYWFPGMNQRIDIIISTCFNCQVATDTHHREPAKMTELPEGPWHTVEIDFCGPFPNGEYALVIPDQYSRYPGVEFVTSTSIRPVRRKLKKVFAVYGIPKVVQTDNGPPFSSHEFKNFASEMGFRHKNITPRHPKAQGQVEGFNKLINKILTIAVAEGLDTHEATYDMLQAYRDTPHPAIKETPYNILMNREIRTRLERFQTEAPANDEEIRQNDKQYKCRIKQYHDKRHRARTHIITIGTAVVVKRDSKKKGQTPYEGSTIYARRLSDGKTTYRDASKIKPLKTRQEFNHAEENREEVYRPIPTAVIPPVVNTDTSDTGTDTAGTGIAAEPRPSASSTEGQIQPRRTENTCICV